MMPWRRVIDESARHFSDEVDQRVQAGRPGGIYEEERRSTKMVWTRSSADTRSKNVWILHGGVPILTAEDMVRPASSEEYLEKELLGTEGQEARGLLYEEVRGPGQPGLGVQPAYLDYIEKRTRPTNRRFLQGGDEDEDGSRKRMRQLIKEEQHRREPTGRAHLPD